MAKPAQEKVSFVKRLKQIGMVFSFTAKRDKWFIPLVLAVTVIPILLTVLVILLGWGWMWLPVGIMLALLGTLIVLNIRSNRLMMTAAEGQPGAAASLIENMRGDWRVTPAVSSTTQMDMVHLVLNRRGVILVGEGNPHRVRNLLGQEKKRLARVIGSAPMFDFVVGTEEGQVPIRKLRITLMKLPNNAMAARDVNSLEKRIKALTARPQMPKGAVPKNMRPPRGAMRQMRGR